MSEHHDHPDDGGVHPHVHSIQMYLAVFGGLIALTILTVATSYIDIDGMMVPGTPHGAGGFNLALAMLIATGKATLVVTWFMHLKDDRRFNSVILIGSVIFVGVFLAYTLNDTTTRGLADPYNGVHVLPDTGERAPGGVPIDRPFIGEEPAPGVAPAPVEEGHGEHAEGAAEHGDGEPAAH